MDPIPFEANMPSDDARVASFTKYARPQFQLRSLPIRYRWEVTRRHPHYQVFWKGAAAFHRIDPADQPFESAVCSGAVAALGQIGVSGEPPDPSTPFEALGEAQLNMAWLSGAVHPITFRGIIGLPLAYLPKETLQFLGVMMIEASCEDKDGELPTRIQALLELSRAEEIGLNDYPDEPFISINPAASGRQIGGAIDALLNQWKDERGLDERRCRLDKYEDYLAVWDLREGWCDGRYDWRRAQKLREIAQNGRDSVSTTSNHYRAAFAMITGHEYSPEAWLDLMGTLHLSGLSGTPPTSLRRPTKSPTRRPVPETTLFSSSRVDSASPLAQGMAASETVNIEDLLDIRALLERGFTAEQIAAELEMPAENVPTLEWLLEHQRELA